MINTMRHAPGVPGVPALRLEVRLIVIDGPQTFCQSSTRAEITLATHSLYTGNVIWFSAPEEIAGEGDTLVINPSNVTPGFYTVYAVSEENPLVGGITHVAISHLSLIESEIYVDYANTNLVAIGLSGSTYPNTGVSVTSNPSGISDLFFRPSNLEPGTYTVTVNNGSCETREVEVIVVKVDYLLAASEKADNQVEFFTGHQEWPFVPNNWSNPGPHLVIFFKDVVDVNLNVQDFDVDLAAHVLPPGVSHASINESWRKISGPDSGFLNRTDTFDVTYWNPKKGGVYKIGFDLGLAGLAESEANIVLPLAGAEIDPIIRADIARADAFAARVLVAYTASQRNSPMRGFEWFVSMGHGDYLGRPNNTGSTTVRKYNQVDDEGKGAVATWSGVPVKVAKASNFIVAYACRKIAVNSFLAWGAQYIGTANDSSAKKSWDAGWAIAEGSDYAGTVSNLVADIWDEHKNDDKNQKLWPNHALTDNYVEPAFFFGEQDFRFTSPG